MTSCMYVGITNSEWRSQLNKWERYYSYIRVHRPYKNYRFQNKLMYEYQHMNITGISIGLMRGYTVYLVLLREQTTLAVSTVYLFCSKVVDIK